MDSDTTGTGRYDAQALVCGAAVFVLIVAAALLTLWLAPWLDDQFSVDIAQLAGGAFAWSPILAGGVTALAARKTWLLSLTLIAFLCGVGSAALLPLVLWYTEMPGDAPVGTLALTAATALLLFERMLSAMGAGLVTRLLLRLFKMAAA